MAIQYLKKSPKTSSTDDTKTREIVENILKENSVHFDNLGEVQKDNHINIDNEKISVDELSKHNKNWLMEYMAQ